MGKMTIAFDTNVLIYLLGNDKDFGVAARDAFTKAIEQGRAVISTIAVAEYLSGPFGDKKTLDDLLTLIDCTPVDLHVAKSAGQIRQKHKSLLLPDALHLANAILNQAKTFVTNDAQLLKLKKVDGLSIKPLV
jgi:predicted nucleic acid-binding protein